MSGGTQSIGLACSLLCDELLRLHRPLVGNLGRELGQCWPLLGRVPPEGSDAAECQTNLGAKKVVAERRGQNDARELRGQSRNRNAGMSNGRRAGVPHRKLNSLASCNAYWLSPINIEEPKLA